MKAQLAFLLILLAILVGPLTVSALAVDLLQVETGKDGHQWVVWQSRSATDGTASGITDQPVMGNLSKVYWAPVEATPNITGNTPTLLIEAAWPNPPAYGGYQTFDDDSFSWTSSFGTTASAVLFDEDSTLPVKSYIGLSITDCLNALGNPTGFRFVFVFTPVSETATE